MKKILVVEDSELNLELAETILQSNGFATLAAKNGAEAITTAKNGKPDLILMDIQMPEMDGFEAFTLLRKDAETDAIPVIAVTGNATPADLDHITNHGFTGYVTKPYKIALLLEVIRKYLELEQP